MAGENVEIILTGWRAVNRGDLDTLRGLFDPKIEWRESEDLPDAAVYHTCDGALRSIDNFSAVFGELEWELADVIDIEDEVLVLARATGGRDSGSGVPVEIRVAGIWKLRDGLIVRVQWYLDWQKAVRAFRAEDRTAPGEPAPESPSRA